MMWGCFGVKGKNAFGSMAEQSCLPCYSFGGVGQMKSRSYGLVSPEANEVVCSGGREGVDDGMRPRYP